MNLIWVNLSRIAMAQIDALPDRRAAPATRAAARPGRASGDRRCARDPSGAPARPRSGDRDRRGRDRPREARLLAVGLPPLRHGNAPGAALFLVADARRSRRRLRDRRGARLGVRLAAVRLGVRDRRRSRAFGSAASARACSKRSPRAFAPPGVHQAAHDADARQHADPVVLPQPGDDGRAADLARDGHAEAPAGAREAAEEHARSRCTACSSSRAIRSATSRPPRSPRSTASRRITWPRCSPTWRARASSNRCAASAAAIASPATRAG